MRSGLGGGMTDAEDEEKVQTSWSRYLTTRCRPFLLSPQRATKDTVQINRQRCLTPAQVTSSQKRFSDYTCFHGMGR